MFHWVCRFAEPCMDIAANTAKTTAPGCILQNSQPNSWNQIKNPLVTASIKHHVSNYQKFFPEKNMGPLGSQIKNYPMKKCRHIDSWDQRNSTTISLTQVVHDLRSSFNLLPLLSNPHKAKTNHTIYETQWKVKMGGSLFKIIKKFETRANIKFTIESFWLCNSGQKVQQKSCPQWGGPLYVWREMERLSTNSLYSQPALQLHSGAGESWV